MCECIVHICGYLTSKTHAHIFLIAYYLSSLRQQQQFDNTFEINRLSCNMTCNIYTVQSYTQWLCARGKKLKKIECHALDLSFVCLIFHLSFRCLARLLAPSCTHYCQIESPKKSSFECIPNNSWQHEKSYHPVIYYYILSFMSFKITTFQFNSHNNIDNGRRKAKMTLDHWTIDRDRDRERE